MRGVEQGALTTTTFTTVFVLGMDAGEYDLLNACLQVASGVSWLIQFAVNSAVDKGLPELSEECHDRSLCLGDKADLPVVIAMRRPPHGDQHTNERSRTERDQWLMEGTSPTGHQRKTLTRTLTHSNRIARTARHRRAVEVREVRSTSGVTFGNSCRGGSVGSPN
ncbi:hypothetical protein ACIRD9_33875 [Streptomyces violaceus]|uniref:hypothetical protein n=1 Tax=Streptomyces violaceus TaxID=1936 RepID=UPI003824B58E